MEWSHHIQTAQKDKHNTEILRKAITNKSNSHHTDPMFNTLKIMKFDEIEKFELCKLLFCVKEKLLPAPIYMFSTLGKKLIVIIHDIKIYLILKNIQALNLTKVFCVKG